MSDIDIQRQEWLAAGAKLVQDLENEIKSLESRLREACELLEQLHNQPWIPTLFRSLIRNVLKKGAPSR